MTRSKKSRERDMAKIGIKTNYMEKTTIKGFPVYQNGQDFIIGTAKISDLLKYTMFTERLVVDFDEDEKPIYSNTIQRKVEKSRANQIADFLINDETATFPTNIVLGIPLCAIATQCIDDNIITLTFKDEVIQGIAQAKQGANEYDIYVTIIDGQHRVRGIELAMEQLQKDPSKVDNNGISYQQKYERLLNMDIVISCFMDKSLEYQAMIFSTINRTQKRVSQDLVYSLFGLNEKDSPYKTALEVSLALNGHPKSPFYKRIKLYGNDYDGTFVPPLSQSTMIKKIVSFISLSSKDAENDRFKKRKELKVYSGTAIKPFRNYYADGDDNMISDCMFFYFNSVRKHFPDLWEYDTTSKPTNVLQSTVGFDALMNLLKDILTKENITSFDNITFDKYIQTFSMLQIGDVNVFPMTTKGKKILYNSMFVKVFPNDPSIEEKANELNELRLTI